MTKEEAKDLLNNLIGMVDDNHDNDYDTALKMAIKALEQPCGTCKHEDETDGSNCYECVKGMKDGYEPCEDAVSRGVFEQVMWERDTAIEQLRKLGYGLGQKIEPCDDCVNRQALLEFFKDDDYVVNEINNMPSVNPTRERGTCLNCAMNFGLMHCEEFNPHDIVCEYWESDGLDKDDYCSQWEKADKGGEDAK